MHTESVPLSRWNRSTFMTTHNSSADTTPAAFDDLVLTCCHIREGERPVGFVSHDSLGWVFTCGRDDHWTDCWGMAHAYHFTAADSSLVPLGALGVGGQAARLAAGHAWLTLPVFEADESAPDQSQSR